MNLNYRMTDSEIIRYLEKSERGEHGMIYYSWSVRHEVGDDRTAKSFFRRYDGFAQTNSYELPLYELPLEDALVIVYLVQAREANANDRLKQLILTLWIEAMKDRSRYKKQLWNELEVLLAERGIVL